MHLQGLFDWEMTVWVFSICLKAGIWTCSICWVGFLWQLETRTECSFLRRIECQFCVEWKCSYSVLKTFSVFYFQKKVFLQVSPLRDVVKPKLKSFDGIEFNVWPTFHLKQSHLGGVLSARIGLLGSIPLFWSSERMLVDGTISLNPLLSFDQKNFCP